MLVSERFWTWFQRASAVRGACLAALVLSLAVMAAPAEARELPASGPLAAELAPQAPNSPPADDLPIPDLGGVPVPDLSLPDVPGLPGPEPEPPTPAPPAAEVPHAAVTTSDDDGVSALLIPSLSAVLRWTAPLGTT